jgi:ferric-dicitrate binding protein FerR (iron transport regulator)
MNSEKNQFNYFEPFLIKYLSGSSSEEERNIAIKWINENQDHQEYFNEMKNYFELIKQVKKSSSFNEEKGWKRIREEYQKKRYLLELDKKKRLYIRKLVFIASSAAAALLISFFLGYYLNHFSSFKHAQVSETIYNEIIVPFGAKSQVTLSDGSKVWLNAGSKLRYADNFFKSTREVYLEGEAFFDVTKINHKQFIVKTSNLNIKVYGTQFNVKAYSEENQIQTTLVKGSVAIEPVLEGNIKNIYYLKPNQTATYFKSSSIVSTVNGQETAVYREKNNPNDKIFIINKIDPKPVISWKEKEWLFVGEELGQLAIKLERRYNVKISFEDESLKNYKFSGTLTDLTFEQVLMIIQLSAPILFHIDGNNVVFKGNTLNKNKYDQMISKTKQETN